MKNIRKILAGAAGVVTLVAVTAVAAAPGGPYGACDGPGAGPGGPGPMGMMHGRMGAGGPGGMWAGGLGATPEKRLGHLKVELAITKEQEPAWQAFAAKATEQARQMQATREQHWKEAAAAASAPARMASRIDWMTRHLASMRAMNGALTDLYAVLTPEQRGTVDRLIDAMGPEGHRRGMAWRAR